MGLSGRSGSRGIYRGSLFSEEGTELAISVKVGSFSYFRCYPVVDKSPKDLQLSEEIEP